MNETNQTLDNTNEFQHMRTDEDNSPQSMATVRRDTSQGHTIENI